MTNAFGCDACYGADAATVWASYRDGLSEEVVLVDESHLLIALRRCRRCAQAFVWIFTEAVDWDGGNDRQCRKIVPLTGDEVGALVGRRDGSRLGDQALLGDLGSLGEGRRYLYTDWPSDAPATQAGWTQGRFDIAEGYL
ncbi:MAG: hypothetical protein ACM30G_07265 [Micromonosporaceae bacterium]